MPHRCAFWPAKRTLITADLHLGKCETLRAHGLGLPSKIAEGVLEEQLMRLEAALLLTGAERVLVVGDLLHAPAGLTVSMIDRVTQWRARHSQPMVLIAGNHDRRIDRVREAWRIEVVQGAWLEDPFEFIHDPADLPSGSARYAWCGHIHPTIRVSSGVDSVKLPCFLVSERSALLPAFSCFTSGYSTRPARGDRVYAIADNSVICI